MSEKLWVYHCDKITLSQFAEDRDISEADIIEYLIEHYLGELESVFPKVEDPENDLNIKADLRYERNQDERMGM